MSKEFEIRFPFENQIALLQNRLARPQGRIVTTNCIECRFEIGPSLDSRTRRQQLPFAMSEHLKANGIPARPAVFIATGDTNLVAADVIPKVSRGTLHWVYYDRAGYIDFTWTP